MGNRRTAHHFPFLFKLLFCFPVRCDGISFLNFLTKLSLVQSRWDLSTTSPVNMSQEKDYHHLTCLVWLLFFGGGGGFWRPSKMDQTAWRIFLDKKRAVERIFACSQNLLFFLQKKRIQPFSSIFIRFHHMLINLKLVKENI